MHDQLSLKLGALSDAELVEGLYRVVRSGRRLLAELLAHLCEVEDRRLHLDSGCPSLFAYCMARLGFTEDEAYRRINVARLARQAPFILEWIADGRLSLSVAALLRPHALAPDLRCLIEAVAGKSVKEAREALVAFYPRPDVEASIRKLPRSKTDGAPIVSAPAPALPLQTCASGICPPAPEDVAPATGTGLPAPSAGAAALGLAATVAGPPGAVSQLAKASPAPAVRRPSSLTEPLSPGRFKIQFTADAALKAKLELARDLLRHAIPSGDLAAIVHRGLDLLVSELQKRRSGVKNERRSAKLRTSRHGAVNEASAAEPAKPDAANETAANDSPSITGVQAPLTNRATRRAVWERDGCRCTWRGPDGARCPSRAWLEHDHRIPRALGGGTSVENLRLLCRAHNRRAAELIFGERHVETAILESHRRRSDADHCASDGSRSSRAALRRALPGSGLFA